MDSYLTLNTPYIKVNASIIMGKVWYYIKRGLTLARESEIVSIYFYILNVDPRVIPYDIQRDKLNIKYQTVVRCATRFAIAERAKLGCPILYGRVCPTRCSDGSIVLHDTLM